MPVDLDITSDLNAGEEDTSRTDPVVVEQTTPQEAAAPKTDTQVTEQPSDKPLSIRDTISNAIKGEQETPDVAVQDGRVRNPDGTFAPKVEVPEAVDTPVAQAPDGIDATVFNALPKETQENLARTMEAVNSDRQRFAGYAQLEQVIGPRRQAWALNGMSEVQAVNQLFALSDFASRDAAGFVKYFAQQSNLNLEDLAFDDDVPQVDPAVAGLQREIQELRGVLTSQQQQQQQADNAAITGRIVSVATEKDSQGNLVYPYFEQLGDNILPYVQMEKGKNPSAPIETVLKNAYDAACWGTPSIRTAMQAADAAARAREDKAKSERARNAGASIPSGVPSSGVSTPKNGTSSVRDAITNAIALHS